MQNLNNIGFLVMCWALGSILARNIAKKQGNTKAQRFWEYNVIFSVGAAIVLGIIIYFFKN